MRAFESSNLLADPAPIWLGDAPSLADDDPMAQVLPWLVRHLGVAEALVDETGLDDAASRARPGQLLQSLQQLGFDTQLSHDPLTSLRAADLPAVLRLRTGDACVLTALQGAPGGLRRCQVVVLTPEPIVFTVTDVDLARECAGPALLIRRPARAQRTPAPSPAAEPAPAPLRAPEPVAEPPSPLARALAGRRAALAAQAAPVVAEAPMASVAPTQPPAQPSTRPPALPTLDDVIEAAELASLVARAADPGLANWLQAPAGIAAVPTPPRERQLEAVPPDPVVPPRQMALPKPVPVPTPTPRPTPTPVPRPLASPAPVQARAPLDMPPPMPAADTGPDVVLDLGFLDRQTGAGRLRGQIAHWQHRLRRQVDHLAAALPQGLALRPAPHAGTRPPRPSPAPGSATRLHGPLPAAAGAGMAAAAAPPGRGLGWRPRFGLGWPLGHAPNAAAAANSPAPPARREPTLSAALDEWRGAKPPPGPDVELDFGWSEAPRPTAPVTHAAQPLSSSTAAFFAEPPPTRSSRPAHAVGTVTSAAAGRSVWTQRLRALLLRGALRPRAGQGARRAWRLPSPPAIAAPVRRLAAGMTAALAARLGHHLKGRLKDRLTGSLAASLAAGPVTRLRQATAAAQRWAAAAGLRLERGLGLPLLAACSAVCLLDGLPLAWASMVSLSSLKAAAHLLPGLMRQALAADQAQAAAVLAGATAPIATAKARAPGARPPVPLAANAPRLAAAAVTPAPVDPSTLAMVAARAERAERAEKADRARARARRGVDIATTLRRRSEVLAMGPPVPAARPRRTPTSLAELLAA